MRVSINLGAPVQRRPLRLILEQTHSLDILLCPTDEVSHKISERQYSRWIEDTYVLLVRREPVIDTSRKNNHVVLAQRDADPLVLLAAHIKVPLAIQDIADLLILMQVLGEERLHLFLVDVAHRLRRHAHLVAVLVPALGGQLVHSLDCRAMVVKHAQRGEGVFRDGTATVVRLALVALYIQPKVSTYLSSRTYAPGAERSELR